MKFKIFRLFSTELDKTIGLALLLGSLMLIVVAFVLSLHFLLSLIAVILVTSISYLVFRRKLTNIVSDELYVDTFSTTHKIIFMLCLSTVFVLGLLIIYLSVDTIHRPIEVFLLVTIVLGFILCQEVFLPKDRLTYNILFTELLIFFVANSLATMSVFPINGGDTFHYIHDANAVYTSGSLSSIKSIYQNYPLYPSLISELSLLTGQDFQSVARVLNIIVATCILILFKSWTSRSLGPRQAFYVGVLLANSKWFFYWVTFVVSMNIALLLFCVVAIFCFQAIRNKSLNQSIVVLFIVGIIPFFHPIGALSVILLFLFLIMNTLVWGLFTRHKKPYYLFVNLLMYALVIIFSQWIYFEKNFFDRTIQALFWHSALFDGETTISFSSNFRSAGIYTLDQLNFYFLILLTGIELLRQLREKSKDLFFFMGVTGFTFVAFGYMSQAINFSEILPHRWFLFGTVLMVFPASTVYLKLVRNSNLIGKIISIIFLLIFLVTSIINTDVNRDSPLYGEEITQSIELTSSEFAGIIFLEKIYTKNEPFKVDFRYWDYFSDRYHNFDDTLGYWFIIRESYHGVFLYRQIYSKRPSLIDDSEFHLIKTEEGVNQFYDNGDTQFIDHVDLAGRLKPK